MTPPDYKIPEHHPEEDKRNRAVIASGALTLVQRQALTPILNVLRHELGVEAAAINILYQDAAHLIAAAGYSAGTYDRSTSFCSHAILHPDDLMVVCDARDDERFAGNPYVTETDGVLFYASIVLVDDEKLPLGTLCVFDSQPREPLTGTEIASLRRVSNAVTALFRRHASPQHQEQRAMAAKG